MIWDMVISMMTEWEFWDKFNQKHNPQFYEKLKKTKDHIKIFASYDRDEDTKDITFGDRTMIPLACVKKMVKIN